MAKAIRFVLLVAGIGLLAVAALQTIGAGAVDISPIVLRDWTPWSSSAAGLLGALLVYLGLRRSRCILRYRADVGEVKVPGAVIEELAHRVAVRDGGLTNVRARFYTVFGKPRVTVSGAAACGSGGWRRGGELKQATVDAVAEATGVRLDGVAVSVRLTGPVSVRVSDDSEGAVPRRRPPPAMVMPAQAVSTVSEPAPPAVEAEIPAASPVAEAPPEPAADTNPYYSAIDRMERAGVDREYINGWACGYLHNPRREEQRVTDAYTAGYDGGLARTTDGCENWVGDAGEHRAVS